jgi:hypothetical protein
VAVQPRNVELFCAHKLLILRSAVSGNSALRSWARSRSAIAFPGSPGTPRAASPAPQPSRPAPSPRRSHSRRLGLGFLRRDEPRAPWDSGGASSWRASRRRGPGLTDSRLALPLRVRFCEGVSMEPRAHAGTGLDGRTRAVRVDAPPRLRSGAGWGHQGVPPDASRCGFACFSYAIHLLRLPAGTGRLKGWPKSQEPADHAKAGWTESETTRI